MATGYSVRTMVMMASQTTTLDSGWFAVGRLLSPTIVIDTLEAGGVVSIVCSNLPELNPDGTQATPPDDYYGAPHFILGNVTSPIAAGLGGAFTWIRARYTQGPSPTGVNIYMQSQQAK